MHRRKVFPFNKAEMKIQEMVFFLGVVDIFYVFIVNCDFFTNAAAFVMYVKLTFVRNWK